MKKDKKIGYIGHLDLGNSCQTNKVVEEAKERGIQVVVVGDEVPKHLQVIGKIGHGKTRVIQQVIEESINRGNKVLILDDIDYHINHFVVNGVRYVPIEKETSKNNYHKSKLVQAVEMLADPYLPYMENIGYATKKDRKLPSNIDIIKEYGLIQLKKSTLSSWERNAVVRIFESNFKKVE